MAPKKKKNYFTPIGIDIRDSAVYALQFRVTDHSVEIQASSTHQLPEIQTPEQRTPAILKVLKALAAEGGFVGREVVSALAGSQVDIRPLRLPAGVSRDDEDRFDKALALEARSSLPYSPEEAQIDYLPLGDEIVDGETRFAMLLIAAPREKVNRHLALLKAAHFECVHLEVAPCAAIRVFQEKDSLFALVEMDTRNTIISVAKGENLLFSRTVSVGSDMLIEELAESLGVESGDAARLLRFHGLDHTSTAPYDIMKTIETGLVEDSALPGILFLSCNKTLRHIAQESKRSLDYFSRQRRGAAIQKIYLFGEAMPARMDRCLEDVIGIPVTVEDVFERLAGDQQFAPLRESDLGRLMRSPGAPFATVAGLALRDEL